MALVVVLSALLLWAIYAVIWRLKVKPGIWRENPAPSPDPAGHPVDQKSRTSEEELGRRHRVAIAASDPKLLR